MRVVDSLGEAEGEGGCREDEEARQRDWSCSGQGGEADDGFEEGPASASAPPGDDESDADSQPPSSLSLSGGWFGFGWT